MTTETKGTKEKKVTRKKMFKARVPIPDKYLQPPETPAKAVDKPKPTADK